MSSETLVQITYDRPKAGMWHCGPNPCWVTVTHTPTMTQVRAYGRNPRKARDSALVCLQLLLEDLEPWAECSFPEVLGV